MRQGQWGEGAEVLPKGKPVSNVLQVSFREPWTSGKGCVCPGSRQKGVGGRGRQILKKAKPQDVASRGQSPR